MPTQSVARLNFNRGRVSRKALARTDIERVELSAEVQTNYVPRVLGSMMLRPGWKYLSSTLGNNFAYHIPFVKSTDDTALIELTNMSMRVRVDDEVISRPAVTTTIRGGDFSADISNFAKLSDPGTLPTGLSETPAFSPDGRFLAVAHTTTPFVTIYQIDGTTFTKLTNPSSLPAGNATGVAFSPDSTLMAVSHATTPFVTIYSISGTTFTKLSNPADLPAGDALYCDFSKDGQFLSVCHGTTPFVTIYSISGTTFTKLANPADLPASAGQACAFSYNDRFLAVTHTTTPFVTIYEINGTTFTKLADPGTLPAGIGRGVAFSRDTNYLAVGHGTTPFITIYSISGTTFTKLSNPATLPGDIGQACAFSSDGQYLIVAESTTSPYHTLYRNVAGVWTKQTDLATLPDGSAVGAAFSPNNRFLVISHDTSQFISIYEAYQWLDMDASSTQSAYLSGTYNNTFLKTLSSDMVTNYEERTIRQVIDASVFTRSGNTVKLTFQAASVGTFITESVYIGYQAASGNAYDFASTPTAVKFSGASGFTIANGSTVTSDATPFDFDSTRNVIVAWQIDTTAYRMGALTDSSASQAYVSPGFANEAATVDVTGYVSAGADYVGLKQIQVLDSESEAGLSFIGTLFNSARRVQAVSILNDYVDVEHALRVIVRQGEISFQVGSEYNQDDLVTSRLLTPGEYSFAFTPTTNLFFVDVSSNTQYSSVLSSVQIEAEGDMTIETPYSEAILPTVRHAQSGDVTYLAANDTRQLKALRFAERSWALVDYLPNDGPFRPINSSLITITPSDLTGDINLQSSREYFKSDMVGTLFRISSVGQNVEISVTGANQFSTYIKVTGVGTVRNLPIVRSGTWSATVTLQRSVSEPGSWTDVATFTTNGSSTYNDALDNQTVYYRIGVKTGNYTSGTAVLSLSFTSGSIDGIARVTEYVSPTQVNAIVLSPMGGTTAFETWNEGAWSENRGYPTAVTLHESRLWWAGNDKIYGSESDSYENFDDLVEGDSGPISRSIGEGPVDNINWIMSLQRMMVGAEGSELSAKSSSFDEPLTPSNFTLKSISTNGTGSVSPLKIDDSGIFVHRNGERLMQILYDVDKYDYATVELTRLIPEICSGGIRRIAVQRLPDTRIHCIKNDGTVAVLLFDRVENVNGWIDVTTDGLVEDVVVLPNTPEDAVYYVVNRTINSETKRYLERWAEEEECIGETLNKQLDSYLLYDDVSTDTITGLDHLEGETVGVWGDGVDLGTYTVTSGSITLSTAVEEAVIGLPYTATYRSTKLAYAAAGGTALTKRKKVKELGLIAEHLHHYGTQFGPDTDHLRNLPSEGPNGEFVDADYIHDQIDLDLIPFNDTWSPDSRVCIQTVAPKPATIMGVIFEIETNG